eukprot:PhM_4_TR8769/c0_g1_i2/m.36987
MNRCSASSRLPILLRWVRESCDHLRGRKQTQKSAASPYTNGCHTNAFVEVGTDQRIAAWACTLIAVSDLITPWQNPNPQSVDAAAIRRYHNFVRDITSCVLIELGDAVEDTHCTRDHLLKYFAYSRSARLWLSGIEDTTVEPILKHFFRRSSQLQDDAVTPVMAEIARHYPKLSSIFTMTLNEMDTDDTDNSSDSAAVVPLSRAFGQFHKRRQFAFDADRDSADDAVLVLTDVVVMRPSSKTPARDEPAIAACVHALTRIHMDQSAVPFATLQFAAVCAAQQHAMSRREVRSSVFAAELLGLYVDALELQTVEFFGYHRLAPLCILADAIRDVRWVRDAAEADWEQRLWKIAREMLSSKSSARISNKDNKLQPRHAAQLSLLIDALVVGDSELKAHMMSNVLEWS